MIAFLETIIKFSNAVNERVGKLVSWLTLVLVLFVCFNVISRAFNAADAWRGELEWHIFALIFLFGAGYSFKHERHVRVDLFYTNYSQKDKAWTNLIGGLIFLIPWCLLIIYYAWGFALDSWTDNEISPNPNGLPYRYLIKFAIPIGVSFLLIQAIGHVAQSIHTLIQSKPIEANK